MLISSVAAAMLKRLLPETIEATYQIEPVGLQCDRSKILCRSAADLMSGLTWNHSLTICAVTKLK
jgi:hypothetical protein